MKINEVAQLAGVTVRTLQYYDAIDLLKPSEVTEAGYRLYDDAALESLQQILFFRELDFSLSEIKGIIGNPQYDQTEALAKHKELLLQKRNRINGLIELLDNKLKGETDMSFEQFNISEIEKTKSEYAQEVKERYGQTNAYKECEEKTAVYDREHWAGIGHEADEILKAFGEMREGLPDSEPAQKLVERWQAYITNTFYHCTTEILSGLGLLYISDERFTQNIDQNGKGTAAFMARAIEIYCSK